MGHGKETKPRDDTQVETQERGEIFFFYRPKVNQEEPRSANDLQKMYIVLRPESGERKEEMKQSCESGKEGALKNSCAEDDDHKNKKNNSEEGCHGGQGCEVNIEKRPLLRFLVLGRKSLPDASKRSGPYWGFVELVTTKVEDIKKALSEEEYETATRGSRVKPAARPLAEGVYRILRHCPSEKGMHTHLVYKLELPAKDEKQEVQEALNVDAEGSFIIQIKNPEEAAHPSSGLQTKRKASFPARLQGQFGSYRFVSADPPDFLNYEGCEFILISASDDIEAELGLDVETKDVATSNSCNSDLLNMFGATASIKPLLHGTWA